MSKMKKLSIVLLLIILCTMQVSAMAVIVDDSQTGNMRVALETTDARDDWSGVEISLYRVGDIDNSTQDMIFVIDSNFAGSNADLNAANADAAEKAANQLRDYINANGIAPMKKQNTDIDGVTDFSNLPVGMYFAMKTGGTKYIDILPFIVSVPLYQDTELEYNVTVCPKTEDYPEPTPSPTPSPSSTPEPRLPQTGVTRWPIVVLACLAVLFLVIGILAVSAAKRRERK